MDEQEVGTMDAPVSPLSIDTNSSKSKKAPMPRATPDKGGRARKNRTKIIVTRAMSPLSEKKTETSSPTSAASDAHSDHTGSTTLPTSHQASAATGQETDKVARMSSWLGLGTIAEFAHDVISAPEHFLSSKTAEGKEGANDAMENKDRNQRGLGSAATDQRKDEAQLVKEAARNSFQNACTVPNMQQFTAASPAGSSRDGGPSFDETSAGEDCNHTPRKGTKGKGTPKSKTKGVRSESIDEVDVERLHPMARMRRELVKRTKALSPKSRKGAEEANGDASAAIPPSSGPSAEEIISDKHRKWRAKQIQLAKEEAEEMALAGSVDDGDGGEGEEDEANQEDEAFGVQLKKKGFNNPVQILQQMMSQNCMVQSNFSMATSNEEEESVYEDDESGLSSGSSDGVSSASSYVSVDTKESSRTGNTEDRSQGDDSTRDGGRGRRSRGRGRSRTRDDGIVYTNSSMARKAEAERKRLEEESESENVSPEPSSGDDLSVIGRVNGKDIVRDSSVSARSGARGIDETKPPAKPFEPRVDDAISSERNFVKDFIQKITNEGFPLIWHKVQDSDMYMRPTSILAFIKLEESIDPMSPHSEPCLHWDVIDNGLLGASTGTNKEEGGGAQAAKGSIGLFDILSVEKAGLMNLHSYPFAIPGNSFFVTLHNGGVILFEAKDDVEQKLVITGLRWMVARLAFNLIIGNPDICSELLNYKSEDVNDATHAMDDVTNKLVEKSVLSLSNKK